MTYQIACLEDSCSHWLHVFDFCDATTLVPITEQVLTWVTWMEVEFIVLASRGFVTKHNLL